MIDVWDSKSTADKNHFHFQIFHVDLDAAEREFSAARDQVLKGIESESIDAAVGSAIANHLAELNFRHVDYDKFKESIGHFNNVYNLLNEKGLRTGLVKQLFDNAWDMIKPLLDMTRESKFWSEEWFTTQYPIFKQLM